MEMIEYSSIVGDEVRIHKILDKNTIKRIDTSKALQLPYKDLDKSKDKRWNAKKINAEMLTAIQSGENIESMSERLIKVAKMNEVSAIRAARTMTTSFENLGRLDGMRAMKEDGTIIKKQWLATISTKKHPTREWHKALSGETAEIDEPFINNPNGGEKEDIMYPGDPNASAANVYNCRCTLTFVVEGFKPTLTKGTIKVLDSGEVTEEYVTGKFNVISTFKGEQTINLGDWELYYGVGYNNGLTKVQETAVKAFEETYYGNMEESLILLDKNGKTIALADGEYGQVRLPRGEYNKAQVLSHTHFRTPISERGMLGGPFSHTDILSFVRGDEMKVMRAVAPEGTYTIIKNSDFKGYEFNSFIQDEYVRNKSRYIGDPEKLTHQEYITASNHFLVRMHNVFRENAKEYGYTYFLEKGVIK